MTPRVCYFGAYDPSYPRNLILRRGLALNGAQIVECRVSSKMNTRQRARALTTQFRQLADQCDTILLAEFNQSLALAAWWLARRHRKRLVIDAFTSLYDSAVYDRGIARPGSLSARRYWWIDWLAVRLADVVLVDTAQHRDYFISEFGAPEARLRAIPVGASCEWFDAPTAQSSDDGMLISFYGTYIPLHGIDTILRAAHLLSHQPHLRFEIIGRGQTYKAMQQLAATLNLLQVTFVDSVPAADLPGLVARADICLGIFGTTEKTTRVVPNKVYQTLALGKPVITADTPAVRELFTPDEHLTVVPAGDASALACAIEGLAADFERRAALSKAGRTYAAAEFSEQPLGRRLLEALA